MAEIYLEADYDKNYEASVICPYCEKKNVQRMVNYGDDEGGYEFEDCSHLAGTQDGMKKDVGFLFENPQPKGDGE